MSDTLIRFETAELAKEIKCDLISLGFYVKPNCKMFGIDEHGRSYPIKNTLKKLYTVGNYATLNIQNVIYAPTQTTLQTWLRDIHGIAVYNVLDNFGDWCCLIQSLHPQASYTGKTLKFDSIQQENKSYEGILETGLLEALKLLIK